MADPDMSTVVTTNGILVCDVTGAIGKAELIGVPVVDGEEC